MKKTKCPMCGGRGYITVVDRLSDGGLHAYDSACNSCHGYGHTDSSCINRLKEFFKKKIKVCPECGTKLECQCVIGADQTVTGKTERLYLCKKCLSSWQTVGNGEPERYFFG